MTFSKLESLRVGLEGWARCIKGNKNGLKSKLTRQLEMLTDKERDDEILSEFIDTIICLN